MSRPMLAAGYVLMVLSVLSCASLALVPPHRLLYAAASVVDVVTAMAIAQTIGSVKR